MYPNRPLSVTRVNRNEDLKEAFQVCSSAEYKEEGFATIHDNLQVMP
jgi:hypothetical protein